MTPELTALVAAALLQFAQLLVAGWYIREQGELDLQLSPRDEGRDMPGRAGRANRALKNHVENLVLFAIAVVVVTLAGEASGFTALCAWTYVAARILYVPAYILGWVPWLGARPSSAWAGSPRS